MDDPQHLRVEHYARAHRSDGGLASLARRLLDHLVTGCAECRRAWHQLASGRDDLMGRLDSLRRHEDFEPQPTPRPQHLPAFCPEAEDLERDVARLRRQRARAMQQLRELRRLPAARRPEKVEGASRRFRSRMLAELLLAECREVVRSAPREAESFASLVAPVLAWAHPDAQPWARPLRLQAEAHRANALRVAGDLPAADRAFLELRRSVAASPLGDPAAHGEVLSLEASLRIGQRRFAEAEDLLHRAELLLRHASDPAALYRVLMKQATLLRNQDRLQEALERLEATAAVAGPGPTRNGSCQRSRVASTCCAISA